MRVEYLDVESYEMGIVDHLGHFPETNHQNKVNSMAKYFIYII